MAVFVMMELHHIVVNVHLDSLDYRAKPILMIAYLHLVCMENVLMVKTPLLAHVIQDTLVTFVNIKLMNANRTHANMEVFVKT